jgi:ABC-2 type transport system permease protein
MPDPSPASQAGGSPAPGLAAMSPVRLFYWSLRRELWENRFVYIAPLIVAAVSLLGFVIGVVHLPLAHVNASRSPAEHLLSTPLDYVSLVVMLTYLVVTVAYCLGALHNERSDRSILFWKSLPVSDVTTVIAKASIPMVVLPLITFAIIVVTQGIMLLASAAALWTRTPILPMWAALLYHLLTVHALYYAPFYGWLLLVSAWARRAAFLWASVPVAAVLILERLIFHTSAFANMLLSRIVGGPAATPFPPPGHMAMQAPTLADLGAFLASPGLWTGLAVCVLFLAAAVRLRRYQGPI